MGEQMFRKLDGEYTKSREIILKTFKEMRSLIESQEDIFGRMNELYRKMATKNERDDDISEHLHVSV
jgi:hypothetical protein